MTENELSDDYKVCIKCGETKTLDGFYYRRDRKIWEGDCRACRNALRTERRKGREAETLAYQREHYHKNKDHIRQKRKARKRLWSPEKAEAVAKRHSQYAVDRAAKHTEMYIAEHGSMPLCACGCGETVKMTVRNVPAIYAGKNHHVRVIDVSSNSKAAHERVADKNDDIPVEKFRTAARQVKEQMGLTWPQLAELGGWSVDHLHTTMYDPRKRNVRREHGENFFKRVQGIPVPPSCYLEKKLQSDFERVRHREAVLDRMYMKGAS